MKQEHIEFLRQQINESVEAYENAIKDICVSKSEIISHAETVMIYQKRLITSLRNRLRWSENVEVKIGLKDVVGNEIILGDTVMLNDNKEDLAKVCFGEFGVRNIETEEIVDYVTGFYLKTIETDVMSTIEPFCWDMQINRTIIKHTNLKVRKLR